MYGIIATKKNSGITQRNGSPKQNDQYSRLVAMVINNISKGSLTKEDIEETVADVFVTL